MGVVSGRVDPGVALPAIGYVMWGGHPEDYLSQVADHGRYCKFGEVLPPEGVTGSPLAWFEANHPDWIEYRSDRVTPAWYSDQGGRYVDTHDVPVDIANPAVQAYIASTCATAAVQTGYDGVGFDHGTTLNLYGRVGHRDDSGQWVQQYSGAIADQTYRLAVISAFASIARQARAIGAQHGVTRFVIALNDVPDLDVRPDWWTDLLPSVDVVFDEHGFTRDGGGTGWVTDVPTSSNVVANPWLTIVNDYSEAESMGKSIVINALEPYQIDDSDPPHPADVDWVLANYLLVRDARTMQGFLITGVSAPGQPFLYDQVNEVVPAYSAAVGSPTDGMRQLPGGGYTRSYSSGSVFVNPSAATSVTVIVPAGSWRDLSGRSVAGGTAELLAPHSGLVLTATSA